MERVLTEPVTSLLDPTKRVFAPFLGSAMVIAVAVSLARGMSLRGAFSALFARRVWLHPSALADLRLIAARALLRALTTGATGVSMVAVAALVAGWLRVHLGDSSLRASPLVVGGLYTFAAFVADDLARFLAHALSHRVPWLWAFHRVHHGAEVLTPFTLYRTHPVDAALNQAAGALAVGTVTGVCAWAFGPSLRTWQVFGVDALGALWSLAGANLRHSEVWVSFGPRVERWLLSPAQHQVHHSRDARHRDQNLGTALALWDRLAGTLYVTTHRPEPLTFGLGPEEAPMPHTVRSMLLSPFAIVARQVRATLSPRVAVVAAAVLSVSCSDATPVDRGAVLQGLARCTVQAQDQFVSAAEALAGATTTLAAAPTGEHRAAARTAWERAIDVWQRLEMHRYGPAAAPDVRGGQGLRDAIYAWPDVNRCLIEQRIVSRGYEGAGFAALPASAKGLAALEYLLFAAGTDNACPATEDLNAMGTWAALGAEEVNRRRAAYASAAAADLVARARALRAAWSGGFETQLVTAGRGGTVFRTQQEAFNAVADAVFHLDTDTKDLRLGRPLGITQCTTATCPEAVESPWAARGIAHLRNNLAGARLVLEGCAAGENLGFDDRLDAAGAGALATRLRSLLGNVDTALNALPGNDFGTTLASNPEGLRRVHASVQALTSFLKMEFTVALQITSARVEGDND